MGDHSENSKTREVLAAAIAATLAAVGAHVLGVQQLLRIPNLALYLPAAFFGAAVGATRLKPLVWVPAGVVAILSIVVAYTPIVSTLAAPLTRHDALPPAVDAIAVLSGGFTGDGLVRYETLDRLLTGLSLARRGAARTMLVSRERHLARQKEISDSADLQNIISLAGPLVEVIFVDSVYTTRSEALRARAIAAQRGWSTLAVVTSPMHSRRACATFEAVGFRVVCVPAILRQSGLNGDADPEDRLRAFRYWLYETFASASYASRGWTR
ncbi:MAG TPA: YdcF family protein [Gemmatimonadaceae bacterium]|nr:YdcF family protein [Gemmatimonadaceae bacterium]